MTIRDRIVDYLQNHPEGIDDDELARVLNLKSRQQANQRCRVLEREGWLIRKIVDGKIHNFWKGGKPNLTKASYSIEKNITNEENTKYELWYWEGNVQSMVIKYLADEGFQIRSVADTASHQQGIDIVAERNGKLLWVSVKGYPRGTEKTNASVQAGHWFKQAIFDIIEYRERDKNAFLVVVFPDFPRYRSMAAKISWFKSSANFVYFWVNEQGEVSVE